MAGTRRSARVANSGSAPIYNEDVLEGKIPRSGSTKKRKTESGSSSAAKRGKKASENKQQTLEESIDDSKPAPSKEEGAEDAELAEVFEKSKTEVSGLNGELEVLQPDPKPQKDTEMTDAPAAKNETEEPAPIAPEPVEELLAKDEPNEPSPVAPKSAEEFPAKAETDESAQGDPKPVEESSEKVELEPTRLDELAEPPVEVDGGKHQLSVSNGAPEETKTTKEAPRVKTNGTAAAETTEDKPTIATVETTEDKPADAAIASTHGKPTSRIAESTEDKLTNAAAESTEGKPSSAAVNGGTAVETKA